MANQQGGGRDQGQGQDQQGQGQDRQGQGQGHWLPWNPAGRQGEEDQARARQEREYIENEIARLPPYNFAFPGRTDQIDLTAPQVINILRAPPPGDPVWLSMIIPEPYKKFLVKVSMVEEELTFDILSRPFNNPMLKHIWGFKAGTSFGLRREDILAIARSTTSISIVFARGGHMHESRSMLVLIPQNDAAQEDRRRLARFARSLCGWVFPDQAQLLHYDPKRKLQNYVWLMDRATAPTEMAEEEVEVAHYAYDTELHYLYRRTLDHFAHNKLQGHIKYEMKKVLTIVAHRLLTRLYNSHKRRIAYDEAIGADFAFYNLFCLREYAALPPPLHPLWDDPVLDNDDLRGIVLDGPTRLIPNEPRAYSRMVGGRPARLTHSISYFHYDIFKFHPMRVYQALFGQWTQVGKITFQTDRMTIESYAGLPDANRRPFTCNVEYSDILFMRYCTVGHPGYAFSVHPQQPKWGHVHLECDVQLEIKVIRDLLLEHVARSGLALWEALPGNQDQMIGNLIRQLFPHDESRWPGPTYWCVQFAEAEVRKNYLALVCRLVNKLAIKLVRSAHPVTGFLDGTTPQPGETSLNENRWLAYWDGRLDILRQSRQLSQLPHLVQRDGVFRMRHRWVYALFDAPNDRA